MSGIKDQEKIDSLRQRLYERGKKPEASKAHTLADTPVEGVPKMFPKKKEVVPPHTQQHVAPVTKSSVPHEFQAPAMASKKINRGYRLKILLAGFIFFVLALSVSSLFLIFGNNSISGENIAITVDGPFTIGGGEVLPLQVTITNDNTVPIQAATLIVSYPQGTKSVEADVGDLFTERLALETVGIGETINVPLRAVVFGEENDEKKVDVSIEYRVQGSNATFFKEAEELRFKISSSPIIVRADTLKKVSSGQETEVQLTVTSNSPTTLSEVLIKAEYPLGFDYSTSEPSPSSGQNMWLIEDLEPESSQEIIITGIVVGKETDEYAINFTIGVPNERDSQSLASVFATTQTAFEIEQPFLDVQLGVEGQFGVKEVAINPDDRPRVSVEIENTLDDTIYDVVVEVELSGNAFSVFDVTPASGFYDATTNKITWDVSNTSRLDSINPGDSESLSFSVAPSEGVNRTPQINIDVDAKARRISESSVSEELFGTAESVIKLVSVPEILSEVGHNNGIFTDTGPIPPEVNETTTYTLSFMIENGSNDITETVVTTALPPYVQWLGVTAGAGTFSFNQTDRTLEWSAGNVEANASSFASFQVSLLPRVTQLGTTPTLMSEQRLRATDRFTGTIVRDSSPAVTTRLSSESGFGSDNGVVQQ